MLVTQDPGTHTHTLALCLGSSPFIYGNTNCSRTETTPPPQWFYLFTPHKKNYIYIYICMKTKRRNKKFSLGSVWTTERFWSSTDPA